MNTTETHIHHETPAATYLGGLAGTSVTEGIGAIAAMVLAIVGLAGILSSDLAAIATILVGGVLLMDGGMVPQVLQRIHAQGANGRYLEQPGGTTAEFFGGLAGIVLGILALFQTSSQTLLAVAVLVYGAALLLSGRAASRLNWLAFAESETAESRSAALTAVNGASGYMLIGLAAIVLGILAVIGLVPQTLILVSLLCLSASALFCGSTAPNGNRPSA